jgi:hypothetical protein
MEVPDTVSQNITFTQTVSSWNGSATPMQTNNTEFREKPWFRIRNPAGTTFTLNLPGSVFYFNIATTETNPTISTEIIHCNQAGTAILNIAGDIIGYRLFGGQPLPQRSAVLVSGSAGYTEINCNIINNGYNAQASASSTAWLLNAVAIGSQLAGSSVEINCSSIIGTGGTNYYNSNGTPIWISGPLHDGVTLNVAGNVIYGRNQYGTIYSSHTSGTFTINAIQLLTGTEPWGQGWNEDYSNPTGNNGVYYRRLVSLAGNSVNAVTVIDADIYGPNNIYNSTTNLNFSMVTTGAATQYFYGNIYSSNLNRYQTPLYYDNDNVLWYHMEGTAFVSINPIVWSTRTQFLGFIGGFYHANVVQANDATNLYAPNRCPFIVPALTPNPNYTGGNQLTWVYIRSAENRNQTTTMANADYIGYSPAESNVRLGTVYGNGLRTGTCAVPPPSQVYLGVAVDNTVGSLTGEINTIDAPAIAAAVWNYDLTDITNTTNGPGQRLLNNATIESTGEQIAALGV